MKAFRILVALLFVAIITYTIIVIGTEGADFFTPYFQGISAINWQGQFNLDFGMYLLLSTLWIFNRHGFSPKGIAIGLVCSVGGMMTFLPYLLAISWKAKSFEELVSGRA